MPHSLRSLGLMAILVLIAPAFWGDDTVRDIGSRREIFVDGYLIERLDGTQRRLQTPQAAEVSVGQEQIGGLNFDTGYAVVKDGDVYRMFYNASARMALAESLDGIHWTLPSIGLVEFEGSRNNNLIGSVDGELMIPEDEPMPEVFLDTRPGIPSDERYKCFTLDETDGVKVFAWVSGNGRRYRKLQEEPIIHSRLYGVFDGYESAFWSESEQQYLLYTRYYIGKINADGRRAVARMTSKDFLTWTEPKPMTFGNTGLKPPDHHYNNQTEPYFRAPHIYIALSSRLMQGRQVITREQAAAAGLQASLQFKGDRIDWLIGDCGETVMMSTRGGTRYDRSFMEGFVRPGGRLNNWVTRCNFALRGIVPTGDREMSIYVNRHNAQDSSHVVRHTLRTDGIVAINAPYTGGQMLTRPLKFKGRRLVINYATSAAGNVRVSIEDASGTALPGFGLADCDEIVGDEIRRVVTWKGNDDVSRLVDRAVRLRFSMMDADLFSLQFVE